MYFLYLVLLIAGFMTFISKEMNLKRNITKLSLKAAVKSSTYIAKSKDLGTQLVTELH